MCKAVSAALACLLVTIHVQADIGPPALGVPADPTEVAEADLTVMPDGANLPAGSGDANTGKVLFDKYCMACHGVDGAGGINDVLVGGLGSLTTRTPLQTVGSYWPYATTLFDYIRRAMPYNAPGSLSNDEVYALSAFVLNKNGIVGADQKLDAITLPKIRMPNVDNFEWGYRPARR